MAFQPVPSTAEMVLHHRYTGSDKDYDIVTHWTRPGGWDEGGIQDLAESGNGKWAIQLAAYAPSTAELNRVTTRDLSEEFGVQGLVDEPVSGAGTDTPWLPPNCATGVLMRCAGAGAPRHGYAFWPFVLEADCDRVGTLSGDALDVPGAFASWAGDVEGEVSLAVHVIVSRFETIAGEKTPRDPALTNAVTSYVIGRGGFVSAQRDRRAGPT